MATLTHPKGRSVVVPDETVDYYTSKGWSVAGEKPATKSAPKSKSDKNAIPEGDPTEDWTNAQLDAYAKREGVDFDGVKNKGERLAAIAAASSVPAGTDSAE